MLVINYFSPLAARRSSLAFVIRHSSFVICLVFFASPALAADAPSLLDRPPFDQIVLNEANQNAHLDVVPLNLPQRPPVNLPQEGKLAVQLLERPTQAFEVDWSAVVEIRVYEQMLLDEARQLVAAGDFDSAYDYFVRLSNEYPNLPGLDNAIGDYLRRNAFALYQAKQNDRAMALLLTLYERNPRYPSLPKAVETVAGDIIQQYLRNQQYAAARAMLDLWRIQFKGVAPEAAAAWQRRFETAAERKVDEARQLAGQKQYIPARKAAQGALAIWPESKPAAELLAQIQRDFPFVSVAVFETAPSQPSRRIDDWAALRANRLVGRTLAEQVDFGSEGGIYQSPFGQWSADDSGLILTLKLGPPAHLSADQLARQVLQLVDPANKNYRGDLANLLDGVSISDAGELELHWRRPHVRPEALLQFPPPAEAEGDASSAQHYIEADHEPDQVVFTPATTDSSAPIRGPQAIIERRMPNDEAAVNALLAGEVDALDRVPPWKLDQVRAAQGVRLQGYRLPTIHVLVPNMNRPLLAKREFRRALCFGIDRKWIVERVLLGGVKRPGFEVVSGPFPTGLSLSDPIRYGNNNQLVARPFEPRLAAILAELAWTNVQADAAKVAKDKDKDETAKTAKDKERKTDKDEAEDLPLVEMPELVLAHPSDPVARLACQSIEAQLEREGVQIKLVEFTSDELLAGNVDYDLRYAELAVWEPVTDARLIMGPGGLAGSIDSPYLNSALRRLDQANNWKEVRTRLADIHEIAHHELPVIPLWQTENFFACRKSLGGVGDAPLTLYQNVDDWRTSLGNDVAQLNSSQ
jgi:peptide/nickel transport system substrate-binding protein